MEIRDESALQLADLTEIAWRRKWWLVGGASIGLLAAFLLLERIPLRYTASNTVLVETQEISKEYVQNAIAESDANEELMRTIEGRITSESVLFKLIEQVGASRLDPQGAADSMGLLEKIDAGLSVKRSLKQATVFEISYTAHDPQLAAEVVTEVTETFIEEELDHRTRQSAATAAFMAEEAEQLRLELIEKEARIRRIQVRGQRALPEVFEERRQALAEVRRQLAKARAAWTDEHPNVRRLAREVSDLEFGLAGDVGSELSPAEANLLRDYEKLVARYHEIDDRRLEAGLSKKVDEARQYERFRVLRPAHPPRTPSWPDPRFLYVGGLAGGLALGFLLAGLAEYRNPTFRSVDRLSRMLDVPVLSSIPHISLSDRRVFDWSLWQRITRSWRHAPVDPLIVTHVAPRSAPAEQYRQFLPTLMQRPGRKVVMVTSAGPGDGKSLTCANLAAAAARDLDKWVLLVDADLRRPSVERMLRLEPSRGVSELVDAGGTFSEHDVVETPIPNLSVLPAGGRVRNPLHILGSEAFLKLIEQARRDFDYVFIDSPPLLPVVDTRLLRDIADLVVFVVRADRTPRDAALRSLLELKDVVGVVFNDVHAANYRRHYYSDAYGQYYGRPARADEPPLRDPSPRSGRRT